MQQKPLSLKSTKEGPKVVLSRNIVGELSNFDNKSLAEISVLKPIYDIKIAKSKDDQGNFRVGNDGQPILNVAVTFSNQIIVFPISRSFNHDNFQNGRIADCCFYKRKTYLRDKTTGEVLPGQENNNPQGPETIVFGNPAGTMNMEFEDIMIETSIPANRVSA